MENTWVILSVYILAFLIGLPANLLSFYVFCYRMQNKPSLTDILLLNLTVSDLLFLLILPMKMHEAASEMKWNLPYFLCPVTAFFFFSTINNSPLLLMFVSVDRYLGVAFPLRYQLLKKPVYAVAASIISWIISSAQCSIVIITEFIGDHTVSKVCYENFTKQQLEILLPVRLEAFVLIFIIPLIVCTFCYLNCIRILYALPRIPLRKKQKAIGMAIGTLLVFVICFLPYNISHMVGFITGRSPEWRYYTVLSSAFNTCLDPIIFYFSSSILRGVIKHRILLPRQSVHRQSWVSKSMISTSDEQPKLGAAKSSVVEHKMSVMHEEG